MEPAQLDGCFKCRWRLPVAFALVMTSRACRLSISAARSRAIIAEPPQPFSDCLYERMTSGQVAIRLISVQECESLNTANVAVFPESSR
jgi:hypothetical protein